MWIFTEPIGAIFCLNAEETKRDIRVGIGDTPLLLQVLNNIRSSLCRFEVVSEAAGGYHSIYLQMVFDCEGHFFVSLLFKDSFNVYVCQSI